MGVIDVVTRGNKLAKLKRLGKVLDFSNEELTNVYYMSSINTSAHQAGASIAQAEMISASLRTIERAMQKQSGSVGGGVNLKGIVDIVERIENLAKLTR